MRMLCLNGRKSCFFKHCCLRALGFPVQSFAKQEKELGILRGRSLLAISLKGDRGGRGCKKSLISSLPEGTLCYSEGDIQHFCQVSINKLQKLEGGTGETGETGETDECPGPEGPLDLKYNKIYLSVEDSLCLPRDPALAIRSLLEEGEFSPRDLLILDNQVILFHFLRKESQVCL